MGGLRPSGASALSTFSATIRVVNRVHGRASDFGSFAEPPGSSGFTQEYKLVFLVGKLADGSKALFGNHPDFRRRHDQLNIARLFGQDGCAASGRPDRNAALTGLQFDIVNHRTLRDILQLHSVARLKRSLVGDNYRVADLQVKRGQYISFVSVGKVNSRDPGSSVRVVFESKDLSGNIHFVLPEVDLSIRPFSFGRTASAPVARCFQSGIIPAKSPLESFCFGLQRLDLGQLRKIVSSHAPS